MMVDEEEVKYYKVISNGPDIEYVETENPFGENVVELYPTVPRPRDS